jgi:hypothetical protein
MSKRFCDRCSKMVPEHGLHTCVKAAPIAVSHVSHKAVSHVSHGADRSEPKPSGKVCHSDVERVRRWRRANRERWLAYHADYMRKWRKDRAAEVRTN